LFNGSQWIVEGMMECDMDALSALLVLKSEDDLPEIAVDAWLHHMIGSDSIKSMASEERRERQEFDWSYAITVHKAQGSQWQRVTLYDQSQSFRKDARRWMYTGITRAAEQLTIVRVR